MKRPLIRAAIKASVLVLSPNGQEAVLVKPKKRGRDWELPGGRIDPGESLCDGACREVFEETGIRIQLESTVAIYKFASRDDLMFLFLGRWLEGMLQPDPDEIANACWEPLETASAKIHSKLNRQRFHDCVQFGGAPVYRLIQKSPFQLLGCWSLGPTPLPGSAQNAPSLSPDIIPIPFPALQGAIVASN